MASIGPIITIIGSILLVLVKAWQDGKPKRIQESRDEEIQKGRADIASGNAGAVSVRIDSMQLVQADTGTGSASGQLDTVSLLQQFSREEGTKILPDRP